MNEHHSRRALLRALGGAAVLTAAGALASPAGFAAQFSEADRRDIQRVEQYLNGIKSLQARFQQFSQDGGLAQGWIYVRRPGKMRIEYDPPVPVLIVADGTMVSYQDTELDQLSVVPLSSTPAWFLLRDRIRLTKDVTVTGIERAPGALRMSMYQTDEPESGVVTLVFRDRPLELQNWTIRDEQGKEIQVALFNTNFGVPLENALFRTPVKKNKRKGKKS